MKRSRLLQRFLFNSLNVKCQVKSFLKNWEDYDAYWIEIDIHCTVWDPHIGNKNLCVEKYKRTEQGTELVTSPNDSATE